MKSMESNKKINLFFFLFGGMVEWSWMELLACPFNPFKEWINGLLVICFVSIPTPIQLQFNPSINLFFSNQSINPQRSSFLYFIQEEQKGRQTNWMRDEVDLAVLGADGLRPITPNQFILHCCGLFGSAHTPTQQTSFSFGAQPKRKEVLLAAKRN